MPKYRVTLETTASTYIEVEAEDDFEAVEVAFRLVPRLCAQCAGWGTEPGIDLGDWDTPRNPDGSDADYLVEEID